MDKKVSAKLKLSLLCQFFTMCLPVKNLRYDSNEKLHFCIIDQGPARVNGKLLTLSFVWWTTISARALCFHWKENAFRCRFVINICTASKHFKSPSCQLERCCGRPSHVKDESPNSELKLDSWLLSNPLYSKLNWLAKSNADYCSRSRPNSIQQASWTAKSTGGLSLLV